jgi:hypothetical protein
MTTYDTYSPAGIRKDKGWDWEKMLPSWTYYDMYMDGLIGWDLGVNGYQLEQVCYFVMGEGKQSRDIAIEFDDKCLGMFYYADKTGGTPFVREGEEYVSYFTFQLTKDFLTFCNLYGEGACSKESQEKALAFIESKYGMPDIAKYTNEQVGD